MPSSSSLASFPHSVNRLLQPSQHSELLCHFGPFPWLYTLRSYVFASLLCIKTWPTLRFYHFAMRCDEETRFRFDSIHACLDIEPRMYLFLFPEGTQHSLASCSFCPAGLHLGIQMMNRDRSCATRSSPKATGTFIRRTTQHSQRDHLGPEQAIFLPGAFPCLSTYRSMSRATSRDREVAFHVIHLVSSWNSGLASLGWELACRTYPTH
jgi:hypothetical protein